MDNQFLARHQALVNLGEILTGKVSEEFTAQLHELVELSQARIDFGEAAVSVAFAGGTGVGKSSLFNAVLGGEYARVSAIRPTTMQAHAISDINSRKLLDWLGIETHIENLNLREQFGISSKNYQGLVLIDLPDIDSTNIHNRDLAAFLTKRVDVLIWVLDPQKYADAILHDQHLAQLSAGAKNVLFVMNKIDTLDASARAAVITDAQRLIHEFIPGASILETSTQLGVGITDLKQRIADVVTRKAIKTEALQNQYAYSVTKIKEELNWQDIQFPESFTEAERETLIAGLHSTFGIDAMLNVAVHEYTLRGRKATSWIFSRPFIRRRLNPLSKLQTKILRSDNNNLDSAKSVSDSIGLSKLPEQATADIKLQNALDQIVKRRLQFVPPLWQKQIIAQLASLKSIQPAELAKLKWQNRAPWWSLANMLQWLFFIVFILGLSWQLLYLFGAVIGIILPQPPVWGYFTVPLIMVVAGLLCGILCSRISVFLLRRGAWRQKRRLLKEITQNFELQVENSYFTKINQAFAQVREAFRALQLL